MTVAGARGAEEPRESSARPARAGLSYPFRFLFAARLPRFGVRGGLAAALVLLALAALAPAGPAHAQVIEMQVSGEGRSTRGVPYRNWLGPVGVSFGTPVKFDENFGDRFSTRTRTFTIRNPSTGTLNLTGTPRVSITGSTARFFRVTQQPAASVAPGGTTTFTVEYKPKREGYHRAQISIPNNGRARHWNGSGLWVNVNSFVFNLTGYTLEPVTLTVGAGPHADGGLQVSWSESQHVLNVQGRRFGRYRVFYTQSGNTGSTRELNGHSHHLATLDTSIATTVTVKAYDNDGLQIAEGTTTWTPPTAENGKPYYPGLPSVVFAEWDKGFRYTLPEPVDPDGEAVTEIVSDEDGAAISSISIWNPTTRVLSEPSRSLASLKTSDKANYVLSVNDGSGEKLIRFQIKFIAPLRFSGNPAPKTCIWSGAKGSGRRSPAGIAGNSFPLRG